MSCKEQIVITEKIIPNIYEICDFCKSKAIVMVKTNEKNYDWSISCSKHKKDAIESLEWKEKS